MRNIAISAAILLASTANAATPGRAVIDVKPPATSPTKDTVSGGAMPEKVAPASARENAGVINTKESLNKYSGEVGRRSPGNRQNPTTAQPDSTNK